MKFEDVMKEAIKKGFIDKYEIEKDLGHGYLLIKVCKSGYCWNEVINKNEFEKNPELIYIWAI